MKTILRISVFLVLLCSNYICVAQDKGMETWKKLAELDYETGKMSATLKQIINQNTEVTGFIVPIELDEYIDSVKEFLLVPNPLACIHIPPPPPNQMIFVKMKKAIPLDMDFRGVTIKGPLKLYKSKIEGEDVGFEMEGFSAKEANIEVKDPLMEFIHP